MRRYTLLHPLILSFYSRPLYLDVIGGWRGFGIAYLVVLLSLTTIPGVLRIAGSFSDFVAEEAPAIVAQVPEMTIREGGLFTDAPQPYFIRDAAGGTLIIIDTSGGITSLDSTTAGVLITRTQVIFRQAGPAPRTMNLSDLGNMTIDRRTVFGWLDAADQIFPVVLYPMALAFSLGFHATFALLLGASATIIVRSRGACAGLQPMVRLAAVAMTPYVILSAVFAASGMHLPYALPLGLAVTICYMFFGLRAASKAASSLDSGDGSRV